MSNDVSDALMELNRSLGRIEGKVDGLVEDGGEIKARVHAVEGKVNSILGWAAGAGAAGGGLIAFIKSKLGGA